MTRRSLATVALTLAVAALSPVPATRAAEPRPLRLTLAFTADASGYLEPCG